MEPACSNIVVQRIDNDHTSYMTRVRTMIKMDWGSPSTGLPASSRDFKTSTQYPNVRDYKAWIGLSALGAYPSTVEYHHI